MTIRVFASLPIWGLSFLAVGSVGATFPQAKNSDPVGLFAPKARFKTGLAFRQNPVAPAAIDQRAIRQQRNQSTMVGKGRGQATAQSRPVIGQSVIGTPQAIFQPAKPVMPDLAVISAVPRNAIASVGARNPVIDESSLYGTAARNAYKVYYPQIETSMAPGAGQMQLDDGGSKAHDARALKRNGQYLFYEDISSSQAAGKLSSANPAEVVAAVNAIAQGTLKAGRQPDDIRLTEPVLQSRPLDFGHGSAKPQRSESADLGGGKPVSSAEIKPVEIKLSGAGQ